MPRMSVQVDFWLVHAERLRCPEVVAAEKEADYRSTPTGNEVEERPDSVPTVLALSFKVHVQCFAEPRLVIIELLEHFRKGSLPFEPTKNLCEYCVWICRCLV
jgi:hypothetical protein